MACGAALYFILYTLYFISAREGADGPWPVVQLLGVVALTLQGPCCPRLCHPLVLIHRSIFLEVTTSPGESSLVAKPHIVRVLGQVQRQVRAHLRTESMLDCRRCGRIINVHDRCACGLHPVGVPEMKRLALLPWCAM